MKHQLFGYLKKIWYCVDNAYRRCNDTNNQDYYGRGIKVEFESAKDFADHLMSLDGHDDPDSILDRVDNNKGYTVGNLRFVTSSKSNINRRHRKPSTSTHSEYSRIRVATGLRLLQVAEMVGCTKNIVASFEHGYISRIYYSQLVDLYALLKEQL
jgi:hypothetical protein